MLWVRSRGVVPCRPERHGFPAPRRIQRAAICPETAELHIIKSVKIEAS
jgi:hypothetical protein